jgi:ElaB/YqjD/DUF883 family membrane-anchored ribosome-binding protein
MAETDTHSDTPQPMSDADVTPPPASTGFEPAAPLKDAGVDFTPESSDEGTAGSSLAGAEPVAGHEAKGAREAIGNGAASLQQQAVDRVRLFAEDGKAKAGDALDRFAQMLVDAAAQVDEKLGAQYGDHARTAATTVQDFADSVRDKDVDDLADDVRGYIRKSPAAAVGVTAALGFALARMVHAGLDQRG